MRFCEKLWNIISNKKYFYRERWLICNDHLGWQLKEAMFNSEKIQALLNKYNGMFFIGTEEEVEQEFINKHFEYGNFFLIREKCYGDVVIQIMHLEEKRIIDCPMPSLWQNRYTWSPEELKEWYEYKGKTKRNWAIRFCFCFTGLSLNKVRKVATPVQQDAYIQAMLYVGNPSHRAELARTLQDDVLDILVNDSFPSVRLAVVETGIYKYLLVLQDDEDQEVKQKAIKKLEEKTK